VYRFIVDYNSLFKDPNEDPPAVYWVSFERYDSICTSISAYRTHKE